MNRFVTRPAMALTIAALAITVTGCDTSAPASTAARPSATAVESSTTAKIPAVQRTTGTHGIPDTAFTGIEPFTGPAVARYGQRTLQLAYKEMVNFAFITGWNSAMIAKNSAYLSRADLSPAQSYLTPVARAELSATLAKVVQGDKAAATKMEQFMFFDVTGPHGMRSVQSGKVVTNRRFSRASVGVDTTRGIRLSMTFAARGDIQMLDSSGRHHILRTSRMLSYLLVPNTSASKAERPFLIDSWTIKMTVTPPVAVG